MACYYCNYNCSGTCEAYCAQACTGYCSGTCSGTCSNSCGASCSSTCSTVCYGACTGTCSASCASACTGGCAGTCSGGCLETCSGSCEGGCTGTCSSACGAACTTTCSGSCSSGCTGSCVASCAFDCSTACTSTCSGTCSGGCTGGCVTSCANDCSAGCVNTCSGGCYTTCSGTCSTTCADSCNGNCTGSCVTGCTGSCTATCANNCDTQCTGACSDACSTSCSNDCTTECTTTCTGGCDTTCTGSCVTGCTGSCTATCANNCDTQCSGACSDACSTSCSNDCTSECTATCSGTSVSPLGSLQITSNVPSSPIDTNESFLFSGQWSGADHTVTTINGGSSVTHQGELLNRDISFSNAGTYDIQVLGYNTADPNHEKASSSSSGIYSVTVVEPTLPIVVTAVSTTDDSISWQVDNADGKVFKLYLSSALFGTEYGSRTIIGNSDPFTISGLSADTSYTGIVDNNGSISCVAITSSPSGLKSWTIDIALPLEDDPNIYINPADGSGSGGRYSNGTLTLKVNGIVRETYACRGMGLKSVQKAHGVPNWKIYCGNTPTGVVIGHTIEADTFQDKDGYKYGPYKRVALTDPVSGNFDNAYNNTDSEQYNRSGIQIHGGRSQTSLWNTAGCIRVFDDAIQEITSIIDTECETTGIVTITES